MSDFDGRVLRYDIDPKRVADFCRAIYNVGVGVSAFNDSLGDVLCDSAEDFLNNYVFEPEDEVK